MDHAPRRFTDARHFAEVLAGLTEQIDSGGARGIDYERAAEPRTCAPVRVMGSPVEDLIAERVRLRLVLRHVRNVKLPRRNNEGVCVELAAWEDVRVRGVTVRACAEAADKTRRCVQQWLKRADQAITDTLGERGMLETTPQQATQREADLAKGVVYSTAWEEVPGCGC